MTFVTKLTFASGDRDVLAETVQELKSTLERKGAECKGPHAAPAESVHVPLYKRLRAGDEFSPWSYDVYKRRMEIHGADDIAREVVAGDFPTWSTSRSKLTRRSRSATYAPDLDRRRSGPSPRYSALSGTRSFKPGRGHPGL